MALNKRLMTFVSNWLGVLIAAVIVLISATFGGMYLYARSRVDNAINFATQAITLRPVNGLTQTGTVTEPPAYIYQIVMQVYNPYSDTVEVTLSNVSITLDTYNLPVVKVGSWDESVPTGYQYFEGNFTIDAQTFAALATKGTVDLQIKGTISGSGHYKWVSRHAQRSFVIPLPGVGFHYTT